MNNVYVIFGRQFSIDEIKQELMEEGYSHNFFFGHGKDYDEKMKGLEVADEVWTFGDVKGYEDYEMALVRNLDIWVMG